MSEYETYKSRQETQVLSRIVIEILKKKIKLRLLRIKEMKIRFLSNEISRMRDKDMFLIYPSKDGP